MPSDFLTNNVFNDPQLLPPSTETSSFPVSLPLYITGAGKGLVINKFDAGDVDVFVYFTTNTRLSPGKTVVGLAKIGLIEPSANVSVRSTYTVLDSFKSEDAYTGETAHDRAMIAIALGK